MSVKSTDLCVFVEAFILIAVISVGVVTQSHYYILFLKSNALHYLITPREKVICYTIRYITLMSLCKIVETHRFIITI